MMRPSRLLRFAAALIAPLGAIALVLSGCETAPVTQRQQLILVPDNEAMKLGADAYQQILSKSKVSNDPRLNTIVRRVGSRIARVADGPRMNWEFNVLEDETPNAFALPGGKVGVNTGLFKVARNEAQLAAVMAHEVAHAVARHSAERMSRQILVETGLKAAGATSEFAARNIQILAQAATLGLVLPFGRDQEAEADEIGLMYMARAGYDPRAAVDLWRNFAKLGNGRTPEFLSTHPAPGNRIQRLQELMPKAMEVYRSRTG